MNETPSISSGYYATSNLNPLALEMGQLRFGGHQQVWSSPSNQLLNAMEVFGKQQIPTSPTMETTSRRFVQVFIVDPNNNVPLDDSVLFKGEQKLTDLTDTELFFEVPIAETLKSHNKKRVKWTDKDATKKAGKDVFLDPVKIRDLKMVVVTIASF